MSRWFNCIFCSCFQIAVTSLISCGMEFHKFSQGSITPVMTLKENKNDERSYCNSSISIIVGSMFPDPRWPVHLVGGRPEGLRGAPDWCRLGFECRQLDVAVCVGILPPVFPRLQSRCVPQADRQGGELRAQVPTCAQQASQRFHLRAVGRNWCHTQGGRSRSGGQLSA